MDDQNESRMVMAGNRLNINQGIAFEGVLDRNDPVMKLL